MYTVRLEYYNGEIEEIKEPTFRDAERTKTAFENYRTGEIKNYSIIYHKITNEIDVCGDEN